MIHGYFDNYRLTKEIVDELEKNNPNKTIVLNASTLEIIIISDNSDEISMKMREIALTNIVPLICGGAYKHNEVTMLHTECNC